MFSRFTYFMHVYENAFFPVHRSTPPWKVSGDLLAGGCFMYYKKCKCLIISHCKDTVNILNKDFLNKEVYF